MDKAKISMQFVFEQGLRSGDVQKLGFSDLQGSGSRVGICSVRNWLHDVMLECYFSKRIISKFVDISKFFCPKCRSFFWLRGIEIQIRIIEYYCSVLKLNLSKLLIKINLFIMMCFLLSCWIVCEQFHRSLHRVSKCHSFLITHFTWYLPNLKESGRQERRQYYETWKHKHKGEWRNRK